MKICMINGSPKTGESNSGFFIEEMQKRLKGNEITILKRKGSVFTEEQFGQIVNSDALLFVFPLYIDSIPSGLLSLLYELEEKHGGRLAGKKVYCIVNNGFFEGTQNRTAIASMKLWCKSCKADWGMGIGSGAGEMQGATKDIPMGFGPNKNIGEALEKLAFHIQELTGGEDLYISPNFPRIAWKLIAEKCVWDKTAKRNGLGRKQILAGIMKEQGSSKEN